MEKIRGMSFSRIEDIEQRLFYYLCGLSFFLPVSIAVGNIFLTLTLLGFFHRLIYKREDLVEIFRANRKIFEVTGALLLAVFLSALSSGAAAAGVWKFLERYVYHVAALFPVLIFCRDKKKLLTLVKFLLAGVFVSNLSVIIQALPELSRKYWRFGGVLEKMPQGSLLAMFLPIYVVLLMHLRFSKEKIFLCAAFVVGLAAVLLNGTRGVWMALAILIPLVALIYSKEKLKSLSAMLLIFAVVGGIFASSPHLSSRFATITDMQLQSNAERLRMWQSAFNMFKDHPIFGVGYGQYAPAYQNEYILPEAKERKQSHAHNNVIQMLAECGIVGAGTFVFMWIYFSYFSLRGWFHERNLAYLLFFSVLSGMMLHGFTEFNFETSVTSKIFWYSLGLCLAFCRSEKLS